MSLVEVLVAMALMTAIVPVFGPLLVSATNNARSLGAQSQALDELRVAVATIGRELRSAQCIYEPAPNGPAGPVLRMLTYAGTTAYEVTYTAAPGELRRQVAGQGSTIVAEDLVGTDDAFRQVQSPRRRVDLVLRVQTDPDQAVRDVATTIAGRNAWRDC